MDLNELFESKTIPIGVSIIVIAYLIGYQLFIASTIIRFLTPTAGLLFFFTGILVGMMKHDEIEQSIVAAGITSASGSIAITLITYIIVSMNDTYGYSQFLNIGPSVMNLLIFIVVGAIGGAIGYYIIREIFSQKTREHHF